MHALRGARLTVYPGEVHALLGENGSGKSTLLKILSGQVQPDSGAIAFAGEPTSFRDPTDALRQGIATVTQETTLAPDLSIAENIFLGHRMVRRGRLHRLARDPPARARGARAARSRPRSRACPCAGSGPTSSRWSRSPARSRSTRAC